jgi:kinetochor protein Mis14/NSL1
MLPSILSSSSSHLEIEEHEPFNTKLFERAKDLARQEEDLIEEIAALRRKMPGVVMENVKKQYKEDGERDDGVLRELDDGILKEARESGLGVRALERQSEMEMNWGKGVKGLESLMRTMPETVARKERAAKAETYVLNGDRR